ncbi:MAG: ArsR family transcriptional regulator [Candidatus Heimdallarchaeota archaeon]|nr:ArsR family transcriptional regulator [Candidatus Heimdallarchaeota archaeon]
MSKDNEINELREEMEELKNIIKNLEKAQSEAYKDLDAEEEDHVRKRLEKDISKMEREKRRLHKESLKRERPDKPDKPEHPIAFLDDFQFEFDTEEFKEKLKDLKKKVEKATKEGMKTAEKISERMKKEYNKFLEVETDRITKSSGLTDKEFKEIRDDINHSRKDIDEAQKVVEHERRNVEAVRRTSLGIRRRLERAYRENDLDKQVEIERELKDNERDLIEAMNDLSNTRGIVSQTKREFARLQRRATKIHSAQKHKNVKVIRPTDFDVDGTISEYVTKVVDSVGKNLESSLRTAWGEGKKGIKKVITIDDKGDLKGTILSNGRVASKVLEEFYEEASDLLSALGDKNRLMILKILELSPQYQKELSEDTGLKGGTFKHHTDILQDENYITREAIRGRYLITQLGLEALKLSEMIYLRKKQLEEVDEDEGIDIDID